MKTFSFRVYINLGTGEADILARIQVAAVDEPTAAREAWRIAERIAAGNPKAWWSVGTIGVEALKALEKSRPF
jgi:hypothetical protein